MGSQERGHLQSWFECKVTYERAGEKGLNTKVNEVYLVQGFTFTEIEKRLTQELKPCLRHIPALAGRFLTTCAT